jgi:hypothetical protein
MEDVLVTHAERIARFLDKTPEAHTWTLIEVGPDFTIEALVTFGRMKWEIQRMGGHAGMFDTLDEALIEVLNQDENLSIPQDIARII